MPSIYNYYSGLQQNEKKRKHKLNTSLINILSKAPRDIQMK